MYIDGKINSKDYDGAMLKPEVLVVDACFIVNNYQGYFVIFSKDEPSLCQTRRRRIALFAQN